MLIILVFFKIQSNNLITGKSIDELKSLPYLTWTPIDEKDALKTGVTFYDEILSFKGVNIYSSGIEGTAYLIDMDGNKLHNWSSNKSLYWNYAEMNNQGDLFVISGDKLLMKINWNSNIQWISKNRYHHDIALAKNGDIYCYTRGKIEVPFASKELPLLNDYITILSPKGKIKKNISIFKLFGKEINQQKLKEITKYLEENSDVVSNFLESYTLLDIFHSNSIEIINKDITGFAKKGNVLISIRELNTIAVIDLEKEEIIWRWGENYLKKQHHPTLLTNNNILIFDNLGLGESSRIVELNPITKKIEWVYDHQEFYSDTRGGNQRLSNGNTLITESNSGHVFEVTKDKKVVWEFWNPVIKKDKRATIYRMMRLDNEILKNLPFNNNTLKRLKAEGYIE